MGIEDKSVKYEEVIEGLLYLSGNQGVTISEIMLVLKVDQMTIEDAIDKLESRYKDNGGLDIIYTNNTYKMVTKTKYFEYFKSYANLEQSEKIGNSALETLAIIAYNQPITKFEMENLKGLSVGHNIQALINKDLIFVSGKSQEIGKPNLYSTTGRFLDFVGINSLEELPKLQTFMLNMKEEELLDLENYDYKDVSKKILNEENTLVVEQLDEQTLLELEEIEDLNVDFEIKEEIEEE